jgi:FixJ family two-component response regulator
MPHRRKVVAVVDDEPTMLKAIERLLNAHGFVTRSFASAEAFLDGDAQTEACCLVLDIHLGGMSGIDLRQRLAEAGFPLPVIFMTAVDDEATRRQAMDAGCVAYLRKPFPAKTLIGAIGKATEQAQQ